MQDSDQPTKAMDYAQIVELITKHYSGLLHLIRSKLKDRELASDLLNEAIVITLEHAGQGRLNQPEQVGGYVFKVSMNLLRNYRRNMDNRPGSHTDIKAMESLTTHDNDHLETEQIKTAALQLIESLASRRDREAVRRFYLDEESKEQICESMGLTPLQFTQVMSRARQRMKSIFDGQGLNRRDFYSFFI